MNKSITKTKNRKIQDQSLKTTSEQLLESMTAKQRQKHEEEYQQLLLSELLIAITHQKDQSVRALAKAAGVSPTIVQAMRSGENKDYSLRIFIKVLQGLRCKKLTITTDQGKNINIPVSKIQSLRHEKKEKNKPK